MNMSRAFMIPRAASTHRFSASLPCRMPMPYGASRNVSFVIRRFRSWAAIGARTVSSHITASARPWFRRWTDAVTPSVVTTSAFGKQRFIHRW